MKLYYVEKANCWVVEGCLSKYATDIISTQFSELGLKVIFCGEFVSVKEAVLPMTGEAGRNSIELLTEQIAKLSNTSNTNLLEIKLKDTDSVPEVWYKGEKLEGLIDVSYHYHTTTEVVAGSTNDINMEYLGEVTKYPDMKTIGHKREV
ncbi:hypothetical protein I131_09615 [Enterococcus faecium CRL1879]|nr:hypothetical protein I131_09615 [Enterococcus faecium CRL1879]